MLEEKLIDGLMCFRTDPNDVWTVYTLEQLSSLYAELLEPCPDCQECAKYAYNDATRPGFLYSKCEKHRSPEREYEEPGRLT